MTGTVPSLVGRFEEQRRLEELVGAACRGTAGTLLLVGEAGIGKSALARRALDLAGAEGARGAMGQGVPLTIEQPLQPVIDALHGLGGTLGTRGRTLIEATVGDPLSLLLQQALDQLDVLAEAGPVVLVLEDLQWTDRATLTLVHHLATRQGAPGVGLVATARPARPGTPLHHLVAGLGADVVHLTGLADAEVDEIAERHLGRPPGPALRHLLATGDGNPMLAEALVEGLVHGGWVGSDPAVAEVTASATLVPGSAVAAQVAAVPAGALQVLQLAAVTRSPVRVDLVARLAGRRPTEVLADLEAAVAGGVLRASGGELTFRHDLHRAAVLATLPETGVAALHLDVARELEALGAPSLEVAEHLARGARRGNRAAVERLTSAAEEVVGHDPATALRVSDLALGLVAEPEAPVPLQVVRVGALAACGQAAEADLLGGALLRRTLPPIVEARLRRDLALAAFVDGRAPEAHAHMSQVVRIAPDAHAAARARTELAWAEFLGLDHVAAAEGAELGAADGDGTTRIAALSLQCWLGLWRLDVELARSSAVVLAELVTTTPLGEWQVFQPLLGAAAVWFERGQLDDCRAALTAGRRLAVEAGTTWAEAAYDAMEASVDLRLGRVDVAIGRASDALDGTAIVDGFGVELWSRSLLAQLHLWRGEADVAEQHVEAAQLAAADGRAQLGLDQLVLAEAGLATYSGDHDTALRVLREGWMLLDAVGIRYVRGPIGVALLRAAAHLDDRSQDEEVVHDLTDAAERSGLPGLGADASRAEAWRTRTPEAVASAVASVRALGQPLLEVEALRDAATILGPSAPRTAGTYRGEAAALAGSLGVPGPSASTPSRRQRPSIGIGSLSDAEHRVAALVAEGLTNAQIAARLIVSRRTVDTQVLAAYRKLGVRSRVELTRLLLGH